MRPVTCPICKGPTREVDGQQNTYAYDTPETPCYQIGFACLGTDHYHIVPEDFQRFVKACQAS
jgi:hypothetical protein